MPTTVGLHGFNGYRPDTLGGEIEDLPELEYENYWDRIIKITADNKIP